MRNSPPWLKVCSEEQLQVLPEKLGFGIHPQSLSLFSVSEYLCHVYVRSDGLAGVVVADSEYPPRVCFTLLDKVSPERALLQEKCGVGALSYPSFELTSPAPSPCLCRSYHWNLGLISCPCSPFVLSRACQGVRPPRWLHERLVWTGSEALMALVLPCRCWMSSPDRSAG